MQHQGLAEEVCAPVHATAHRQSYWSASTTIRYCPIGLGFVVVPIAAHGHVVALVECGRALARAPRMEEVRQLVEAGTGRTAGPDYRRLETACLGLPVVDRSRLASAGRLLAAMLQPLAQRWGRECIPDPTVGLERFDGIVHHIRERLAEPLRLTEVASHARLSPEHFCRLFRKRTGMTFTAFVAQGRLDRAQRLLRTSRLNISEVAAAAGFSSVRQFNHLFKRMTQRTPSEYRARSDDTGAARSNQSPP